MPVSVAWLSAVLLLFGCGSSQNSSWRDPGNGGAGGDACGASCGTGQTCASGACACPSGSSLCDGSCVDVTSDGQNCGQCGNSCETGQVCSAGTCSTSCQSGTACGQSCVDLASDVQNCGTCGHACVAGQACAGSACVCPAGQTECNGACVDVRTDSSNCGNCGVQCASGATCTSGNCSAGTGGTGGTTGGTGGTAGSTGGTGGGTGGATGGTGGTPLDCGPNGWAVEDHGPSSNRVTYVILGDGYTTADLATGGAFETHIKNAMTERFSALAQPYLRYRNFVNICAIRVTSAGAVCSGNDAFGCCGNDSSRLATCDNTKINAAFNALPSTLLIDWRAVVLNDSSWWNTGAATMLWSGGHASAPKAALHEGGHGFHQLADEYCASTSGSTCGPDTSGTGATGTEYSEVNSTGTPATTAGKWDLWLAYTHQNGTGLQSTFQGSRYVDTGQYRPSSNSKMNSLFGNNANTSYNPVSQEQIVMTIWRFVKPIDSVSPPAGAVNGPGTLRVNVIDPAVINVDWNVDGSVTVNGGTSYDTSALSAGTHTVSATAYDNAGDDLVRYRTSTCPTAVKGNYCARTAWKNSTQTVTWTVSK